MEEEVQMNSLQAWRRTLRPSAEPQKLSSEAIKKAEGIRLHDTSAEL
jgi:hypothetical protein